jgi:hypothetical protein
MACFVLTTGIGQLNPLAFTSIISYCRVQDLFKQGPKRTLLIARKIFQIVLCNLESSLSPPQTIGNTTIFSSLSETIHQQLSCLFARPKISLLWL